MEIVSTEIKEVVVIKSTIFMDERGTFTRLYASDYTDAGLDFKVDSVNLSATRKRGTIRGLHMQISPFSEKKIVRCISGKIFDVAVDMREESPTFLKYVSRILTEENNEALFIPEGFAHGFQTLESNSVVHYCTSERYSQNHEYGIKYDDPKIGIKWPAEATYISEKDKNWALIC